jgi:hypothetical protein
MALMANTIGHFLVTDEETDDVIRCDCGSLGNSPRNVFPSHALCLPTNRIAGECDNIDLPQTAAFRSLRKQIRESSAERLKSREDDTHRDQLNPF